MQCSEFQEFYTEVYYEQDDVRLTSLVHRHRLSCVDCDRLWQQQVMLSGVMSTLPEHLPSRMTVNRLLVHAGERALKNGRSSFWLSWLTPAVPALLAFFAWVGYQNFYSTRSVDLVALNQDLAGIESSNSVSASDTPFTVSDDVSAGAGLVPVPHISYVSTGTSSSGSFGNQRFTFDDELDHKKILHSLSISDVSALFDRARKMEKLREYRQALNDYEFIARFHPGFKNIRSVKFSMARCLSAVGSTDPAIKLLEEIRQDDPEDSDVIFWLDQLKSQTI